MEIYGKSVVKMRQSNVHFLTIDEVKTLKIREEALRYGLSFPDTYIDAPFHDENWQLVRIRKNK